MQLWMLKVLLEIIIIQLGGLFEGVDNDSINLTYLIVTSFH